MRIYTKVTDSANHLADLRCGACNNWSVDNANVNTDANVSYGKDMEGNPDTNSIIITCPSCGIASCFPTFDEKNGEGFALGQAKTE